MYSEGKGKKHHKHKHSSKSSKRVKYISSSSSSSDSNKSDQTIQSYDSGVTNRIDLNVPKRVSNLPNKLVVEGSNSSSGSKHISLRTVASTSLLGVGFNKTGVTGPKENVFGLYSSSNTISQQLEEPPSGIFALDTFDSLYICPIKVLPSELTSYNSNRKYEIVDYDGTLVYHAVETERCLMRLCYSETRPFDTRVYDLEGQFLLDINRPMSFCICFCCGVDCFLSCHKTKVRTSTAYLGTVRSRVTLFRPIYIVEDQSGNAIFNILGPAFGFWLICRLCKINEFPICLPDSKISVGKIQLGYDGLSEEKVPNPNTVSVIFPPRCTPDVKACILAAGFTIDITYFHRRGKTGHRFLRCCVITLGVLTVISYGAYKLIFNEYFH